MLGVPLDCEIVQEINHSFKFRRFVEKVICPASPTLMSENQFAEMGQHNDKAGW